MTEYEAEVNTKEPQETAHAYLGLDFVQEGGYRNSWNAERKEETNN